MKTLLLLVVSLFASFGLASTPCAQDQVQELSSPLATDGPKKWELGTGWFEKDEVWYRNNKDTTCTYKVGNDFTSDSMVHCSVFDPKTGEIIQQISLSPGEKGEVTAPPDAKIKINLNGGQGSASGIIQEI